MKKGFTLLELIVVVIVIGILAMVALPRFIRVAERARCAEGKLILSTIRSAQFRYYTEHGKYTNSTADLDTNLTTPNFFGSPTVINGAGERLANITRSNGYNLNITVNGTIECDNIAGATYTCTDAGF